MKKLIYVIIITSLLTACSIKENNTVSPKPEDPPDSVRLTQSAHENQIDICNGSGIIEYSGLDNNDNTILDETEIDSINVTCDVVVPVPPVDTENDDGDYHCKHHGQKHDCKRKEHKHGDDK